MPGKIKLKLLISLIAVLIALVLLVSVTLAWFSASTNPEASNVSFNISVYHTLLVSLSQDGPWGETRSLIASFTDENLCKILQPVSTLDGINWFAPTYVDGAMSDVALFERSNTLEWGNVSYLASYTDASGTDLTNEDDIRAAAEALAHFMYTDFWICTEYPDGCTVRLSVPEKVVESELDGYYGSYVMPKYVASGTDAIVCDSNAAETAVRIGFQIYGDGPDASPTDFIIYEPNADKRSSAADKETAGEYVLGYQYSAAYSDANYLKTNPIGWIEDLDVYVFPQLYVIDGNNMIPYTGLSLSTDTDYYVSGTDYVSATDTPHYWENNQAGENYVLFEPPVLYGENKPTLTHEVVTPTDMTSTYYYAKGYCAKVAEIDPSKLIVQKACTWNLEKVKEKVVSGQSPNSTAIADFGHFLNTDDISDAAGNAVPISSLSSDIAGNAVLLKLPDTTPIKIRVFVWVEGQDPDCWNDIHTGWFRINIEMAGETKY